MSSSCNPFIGRAEMITYLARPPKPEPGIAVVLVKDGQAVTVLKPGGRSALQQLRWGWWEYEWAYRIDVGIHTFSFKCALPSKSSGLDFQAEAHVTYAVADPIAIVNQKIRDMCAILEPLITNLMRAESRKFELDKCDDAENAIGNKFLPISPLASTRLDGFEIHKVVVNLSVEDEEREHARRMRMLERNRQYEGKNVEYRQELEGKHAELRKKIFDSNSQFNKATIEQWMMLDLLDRPAELRNVLESLNKHVDGERGHWVEMLKLIRDANALEPQDLKELREFILKRYQDLGNKRFG